MTVATVDESTGDGPPRCTTLHPTAGQPVTLTLQAFATAVVTLPVPVDSEACQ